MKHIVGTNTDSNWSNVRRIYRNYERNDMRILKRMFWCGRYFGVTPFSLTGKRDKAQLLTFSALLAWSCYGYIIMAAKIVVTDGATVSLVVADFLWDATELAFIFKCLTNSNIPKVENWKNLYRKLEQGEILLSKHNFKVTRKLTYFYCEILLTVFVFFCVHGYRFYTRLQNAEYGHIEGVVGSTIINFYANYLLIVVCSFTRIVQKRFAFLNETVLRAYNINEKIFLDKRTIQKLNEVISLYRIFHLAVDSFNEIFGWHIFIYVSISVTYVLGGVLFSMEFDLDQERGISLFMLVFINVMAVIILVLSCDSAEKSGKEIIKNCNLLHHQADSELVKERLLQLACYGKQWRPIISAAGFYNINQHTLVNIFEAIITYLVILIQFSLALKN